ncbi:RimJ/RimL family protein N-acetyltransferase [Catenuloplanes nepalensis]|uniref:RimJ/RimL family protein N-acetyltransferase n=1 Tax=Catenuloplanes nepalensis TaxID=587533 RepID=A0ABT9N826_9ACTN|nr:GNAT family N-acetyltransferase [Catenuloplanes nepalensis]MDP9799546.1 RimJ/RimL family protein N-acetyltransferase [Catenuloplanes nepalensis]
MDRTTVEDQGVRLRPLRRSDAPDVVAACSDPLTQRFLPLLPRPYTEADALWWIEEGAEAEWRQGGGVWAVADPATDRLAGTIGLHRVVRERAQAEVGYWVAPWARGRGIATAATVALSAHAFAHGFARLELLSELENVASQRVALAAGFQREAVRRGVAPDRDGSRTDLVAFARLAGDPAGPVARWLPDLPGGELSDGVVTLRPLRPGDEDFLHTLLNQPDVVATSVPAVAPDRREIALRCARSQAHWLAGDRADLVIVDTATGRPAGDIGLYYQERNTGQAMIGYAMLPEWRGRGFPTRAVQLVALWAFAETSIARLVAGTNPQNAGSQRVLEKAGFQREGYHRSRLPAADGRRVDDVLFAMVASDLLSRTAAPER